MATTASESASALKPRFSAEPPRSPKPVVRGSRRSRQIVMALAALASVGGLVWGASTQLNGLIGKGEEQRILTQAVARGGMVITVVEDGNVESASNIDVKCQVAGGSSILWIVPDGSVVKKGDELVRLDSSTIEEQVNQQKIVFERAQAARIQSEREFSAAKIAVQEYVEGTFIKELQAGEAQITIAMENLRSSENVLQHTTRMARKGYVTPLQLDSQKFAVERAKLDLDTARTTKSVLEKFTKVKMLEELESKRDSAEAKMRSEQAACDLEGARLKRLTHQLEQCVVTAPQDGMVVFANETGGRGNNSVKIEEGAGVRERQSIVRLPDLSEMQVKVAVHESKVDSLAPGMRARVTIQDREFQGEVKSIANQPEPTSFSSSNVKEYATIVKIDGHSSGLKPGMTAHVEILVADLQDVLSVPVQSVVEQGGKFACWIRTKGHVERRPVVVGASNSTVIEIKDGLAAGDEVLLNPRAVVAAAREDVPETERVDTTAKFGRSSKPATTKAASDATGPSAATAPDAKTAGGAKPRGSRGAAGNIMALDRNGDGKISLNEAPEPMRANFDKLDTNGDGALDKAEIAALQSRMSSGAGGPPGTVPPGTSDGGW